MEKTIVFNTKGYEGFIDFVKAYAILCVLFGHTFSFLLDKVAYGVWAGMQVPLFILVQTFHCYKKEEIIVNVSRVFFRVLLPFFVIEFITFLISICFLGLDYNHLVRDLLSNGGMGPGSYFPWIYLQVAILLPVFAFILRKYRKVVSLFIFLIICEGGEILFSLLNISEELNRLLSVRYFFLFFLGWLWVKDGVKINWLTITFSILSLSAIVYFEFFSQNDEPWFYTTGFSFHRWPCYFYVSHLFIAIIYLVWEKVRINQLLVHFVKIVASASYEIFLIQMSLLFLFPTQESLSPIIPIWQLRLLLWLLVVWAVSIFGGIVMNRLLYKKHIAIGK